MHGTEVSVQDNEEMIRVSHAKAGERKKENALHLASEACRSTSVDTFSRQRTPQKACNEHDQVPDSRSSSSRLVRREKGLQDTTLITHHETSEPLSIFLNLNF